MSPLVLLLLAGGPSMAHGVATLHSGRVVAAPHEGFDDHTAPMARGLAQALGWGWVVAEGYRSTADRRWFDVNRPTERPWEQGRRRPERITPAGREVYARYQELVLTAGAGDPAAPLDVLVEIHGHARRCEVAGEEVTVQAIELATRGFDKPTLWALKRAYLRLVSRLPEADQVPLAIEQLDPVYDYQGVRLPFYFGASGAKEVGSLREERARRALHFELPQHVRFSAERRALYTRLLAELLSGLD